MESKERSTDAKASVGNIPSWVEGSVEVSSNTRIDVFVEINLILSDLSELLLSLEDLKGQ
jgi:hypothetical protein